MNPIKLSILAASALFIICVTLLWGCPRYKVYSARKDGEAKLAEAISSKQVVVQEALAKYESAKLLSEAETWRAHGVARSNTIIGKSLTRHYLHWFWIDNIDKSSSVIYVPSEANLPVMESTRFFNTLQKDSTQ